MTTLTHTDNRLWNRNYTRTWLSNFLVYFSFMLLTPLFPLYLADTFNADKDTIGLVLAGYTIMELLVRPFSGYMVDNFSRRTVLLVSFFLFFACFAGYLAAGSLVLFAIVRTLHGGPFGAATVANSTVAIDVLPPSRRAEGVGYYGLSNNIATAISPMIALALFGYFESYTMLFLLALVVSGLALWCSSTVQITPKVAKQSSTPAAMKQPLSPAAMQPPVATAAMKQPVASPAMQPPVAPAVMQPPVSPAAMQPPVSPAAMKQPVSPAVSGSPKTKRYISFDRFILLSAWRQGICIACFAFAYGVLSTYIAIYGRDSLGITQGTGVFFLLMSVGLALSRLTGGRTLRKGLVARNASLGIAVSLVAYILFATIHTPFIYYLSALVIGLGNGHMFPAIQTMFLMLAGHNKRGTANSTLYVAWDTGFGIGILLGGVVAQAYSYFMAYNMMAIVCLIGSAFYYIIAQPHFVHASKDQIN